MLTVTQLREKLQEIEATDAINGTLPVVMVLGFSDAKTEDLTRVEVRTVLVSPVRFVALDVSAGRPVLALAHKGA